MYILIVKVQFIEILYVFNYSYIFKEIEMYCKTNIPKKQSSFIPNKNKMRTTCKLKDMNSADHESSGASNICVIVVQYKLQ